MKRHKRGDIREDGKVFWQYSNRYKSGAIWITKSQFKRYYSQDFRPSDRPLKCGDVREDGKVFWCYNKGSKNGEWWIDPEKHKEKMEKARERDSLRYAKRISDPNFKRYHRERHKVRVSKDMNYRLAHNLRSRLSHALSRYSKQKKSSHIKDLGCDFEFFVKYLETRFKKGMTWGNYGKFWSIDHVRPCASFDLSKRSEQKKMCHYTNLAPITVSENSKKRNKELKQQKLHV